jgi:hypothetical protein
VAGHVHLLSMGSNAGSTVRDVTIRPVRTQPR